jgi:hypothetical protein
LIPSSWLKVRSAASFSVRKVGALCAALATEKFDVWACRESVRVPVFATAALSTAAAPAAVTPVSHRRLLPPDSLELRFLVTVSLR